MGLFSRIFGSKSSKSPEKHPRIQEQEEPRAMEVNGYSDLP
jgi:hypothetical protein